MNLNGTLKGKKGVKLKPFKEYILMSDVFSAVKERLKAPVFDKY